MQEVLDRQPVPDRRCRPADRRLATQLAYGVLRRRGTLLALLRPLITRGRTRSSRGCGTFSAWARFNWLLLTRFPLHAALNETVELAAHFGRPGAKGFINGVLRALSRLLTDEAAPAPQPTRCRWKPAVIAAWPGPCFPTRRVRAGSNTCRRRSPCRSGWPGAG